VWAYFAICHPRPEGEFSTDVVDVALDRGWGEVELVRDFLVRHPVRRSVRSPVRSRFVIRTDSISSGLAGVRGWRGPTIWEKRDPVSCGREDRLAPGDVANGLQELDHRRVLGGMNPDTPRLDVRHDIPTASGRGPITMTLIPPNVFLIDFTSRRLFCDRRPRSRRRWPVWWSGIVADGSARCFRGAATGDADVGLLVEHRGDPVAQKPVILDDQDRDFFQTAACGWCVEGINGTR